MQYLLLTRHSHRNEKLGEFLGVGDMVRSEDPALVRDLLEMRGGSHYSPAGFSSISGQGFPYFTPDNFTLAELRAALAALEVKQVPAEVKAPKVEEVASVVAAPVVEEPVAASEVVAEPVAKEAKGRRKLEAEAAQAE